MTRVLPRFPTAVRGINALSATTQNGVLEVGIDPTNLAQSADPTAPGNYTFILNSTTDEFELAEVASTIVDIATQGEAEAGTDNTAILTPLRAAQEIEANVYPTQAELLTRGVPAALKSVSTSGRTVRGIGAARNVEVPNTGPLQPGQFQTNFNLRRWENAEDTITPAMFSDITEMFAFTKAQIQVPAASYEFDAPIVTRAGLNMRTERGAVFRPTFEPTGTDRATPMMTLGDGAIVDRLEVNLVAGIDTIRTLVRVNTSSRLGKMVLTSTDMNNNRTESGSTDLISGAVVLSGGNIGVDEIVMSRFDRGLTIVDTAGCRIGKVRNLETIMGIYIHGSRDVHIHSGYSTGAAPDLAAPINRGPMTPGANSLVLAGCSDSSFSNWFAYDMLEHAVRVGGVAAGTSVPNHRLVFRNHQHYRPYGCGMKFDDGDAFNIKRAMVDGLYTEDVGHDNWFGNPDYQNWASGGVNNPLTDNDGNKVACAIRNSENVQVTSFMNRANAYANSGYMGFWVERSQRVFANGIDTHKSRTDGVVVQSGGATSPEEITLDGVVTRFNGGAGLKYNASPSNATWSGVVTNNLISEANTGYGVEVTTRFDGASPYATCESRISGRVANNTAGPFSLPAAIRNDSDFVLDVRTQGIISEPTLAFATVGDSTWSWGGRDLRWWLDGQRLRIKGTITGTPTFTTASGDLRLGTLPFAALNNYNAISLRDATGFSSWNSRTQIVGHVQQASNYMILRGMAANASGSTLNATNVTSGTPITLTFDGEYVV